MNREDDIQIHDIYLKLIDRFSCHILIGHCEKEKVPFVFVNTNGNKQELIQCITEAIKDTKEIRGIIETATLVSQDIKHSDFEKIFEILKNRKARS